MNKENCIEWLTGDDTITVSLTQRRYVNRVKKLAEQHETVSIEAENADGSIVAHLPISALHLTIYSPRTGQFAGKLDLLDEDAEDDT